MLADRRWRIAVVAGLLLAGLTIRIAQIETTSYRARYDAAAYMTLAGQVARSGDYTSASGAAGTRGPTAYFPPGYPYLLAGVGVLSGREEPTVRAARLSQALLGTLTVALVGLVALEACGAAAGLAALALAAVHPVLIELSAVLAVQNLLTPLLLAAAWTALRARRATTPYPWLAAGGACLGLAALTHQEALVAAIPLAWAARSAGRRGLGGPALLLVTAALVIAPWTIRNANELHTFVPISDETGLTLGGTYNSVSAADSRLPYRWLFFSRIPADRDLATATHRLTEPGLSTRLTSRALHYIGHHPLAPLAAVAHNTLRLLELEGSFAWRASAYAIGLRRGVAAIGVVSFWLLALLAADGAFTRLARAAPRWLWATAVLLWLAVAAVNAETPRFREPLEPFLLILAACALASLAPRVESRLRRAPIGRQRRPPVPGGQGQLVEVRQRLA